MNILKSILKMIAGFAAGILIGLAFATVAVVCFSDTTMTEFIAKLTSSRFANIMLAAGAGMLASIFAVLILIPIHEAGHLVCGLLSGYRFVSFRIFNLTIIKENGRYRIKRYAIAGTGGQCLLTPPDLPLEQIPTGWYNFGGTLANIVAVGIAVPFLFLTSNPLLIEVLSIYILAGVFLILVNGVPMKLGGAGNDGYNLLRLRKNLISKRGFIDALRANALIQNGIRPKDMPDRWFEVPAHIDYRDQLQVSIPMMAASRKIDGLLYAEALADFENLYAHKSEIIGLFVKEIECELLFLRLVCGQKEQAMELFDKQLLKYIETYSRTMSSKQRILCAIALYADGDRDKATEIYRRLAERKDAYLLQGEVESDLAIMADILAPR